MTLVGSSCGAVTMVAAALAFLLVHLRAISLAGLYWVRRCLLSPLSLVSLALGVLYSSGNAAEGEGEEDEDDDDDDDGALAVDASNDWGAAVAVLLLVVMMVLLLLLKVVVAGECSGPSDLPIKRARVASGFWIVVPGRAGAEKPLPVVDRLPPSVGLDPFLQVTKVCKGVEGSPCIIRGSTRSLRQRSVAVIQRVARSGCPSGLAHSLTRGALAHTSRPRVASTRG